MISTILAAALAALQGPAVPAGWEELASGASGVAMYERASVRGQGSDRLSVRIRITNTPPDEQGVVYMDIHRLYDCGDRTVGYVAVHSYDAQGAIVVTREIPMAEAVLEPFAAGSIEAILQGRICRGR